MPPTHRTIILSIFALSAALAASARAQNMPAECASLLKEIQLQQNAIATARRVLSEEEAECAFADFTMPVAVSCAQVKAAAERDTQKRRAWTESVVAWSAYDRLRLALRATEDRLGVTCDNR